MLAPGRRGVTESGVTPVVAVMLLLIITVILTSVVYVTVTTVGVGPGEKPIYLGVNVAKQGNFYSVNIVAVSPQDAKSEAVSLVISAQNGTVLLPSTRLSNLAEFRDSAPVGTLNAGDYVWFSAVLYPPGNRLTLATETQLIYSADLPG